MLDLNDQNTREMMAQMYAEQTKQVFREEEEENNERDQIRKELEQTRLNLAKLKEEEQQLKNAKLRKQQREQEREPEPDKSNNKLYCFTLWAMIVSILAPFIVLLIAFIKW